MKKWEVIYTLQEFRWGFGAWIFKYSFFIKAPDAETAQTMASKKLLSYGDFKHSSISEIRVKCVKG